jgi:hypothetical protein
MLNLRSIFINHDNVMLKNRLQKIITEHFHLNGAWFGTRLGEGSVVNNVYIYFGDERSRAV